MTFENVRSIIYLQTNVQSCCLNKRGYQRGGFITERIILHIDMNNFYASVECLYRPELKDVPMAVGGDKDSRHGIVLAKNQAAKAKGVKTAEALWQAEKKCPGIVFVKPNFERYMRYSEAARAIYCQYTDEVENFGLDECWLDVTGSTRLFGSGRDIAEEIRERIKNELGLTVSIGVSFNKIFSKLGSDYKKPDAVTEFTKGNFKEYVWPLPAREMLNVGPATEKLLVKYGIKTIGDIARSEPKQLEKLLGRSGLALWHSAAGLDSSPVAKTGEEEEIKSIGNSTTTPRDLITDRDFKITLYSLSETVSHRLREKNLSATGIQLSIRSSDLETYSHQCVLDFPAADSDTLFKCAYRLYQEASNGKPVRSLGIRAIHLVPSAGNQFSLFKDEMLSRRRAELETTVDMLRERYGSDSLRRGILYVDKPLARIDAEHEKIGGFMKKQRIV